MTRALQDLAFAGIAAWPFLGAVTLYGVCRHAERRAERKPVCGLQYEFTTAALWDDPDRFPDFHRIEGR